MAYCTNAIGNYTYDPKGALHAGAYVHSVIPSTMFAVDITLPKKHVSKELLCRPNKSFEHTTNNV